MLTLSQWILDYIDAHSEVNDIYTFKLSPYEVEGIIRSLDIREQEFILRQGPTYTGTSYGKIGEKITNALLAKHKMMRDV